MEKHLKLLADAQAAIDRVFHDDSVPLARTQESILALQVQLAELAYAVEEVEKNGNHQHQA